MPGVRSSRIRRRRVCCFHPPVGTAVSGNAIVCQSILLFAHAAAVGDHAVRAARVALDRVYVRAVYPIHQSRVRHRRAADCVLRPEEDLVAGLRRVKQTLRLLVVVPAVAAAGAAVRLAQRLIRQLQRRLQPVGPHKAPVHKNIAPRESVLAPVVKPQRVQIAGILCVILVAGVRGLVVQLRVRLLLQITDFRLGYLNYLVCIIAHAPVPPSPFSFSRTSSRQRAGTSLIVIRPA